MQPGRRLFALSILIFFIPAASPAADPDPLEQVVARIKESRKQLQADKSVANQVRLGTWLVMFGELAADRKDLGLCSRASDAFDEGLGLIAQVQLSVDKDMKVAQQIAKEPAIAMRLDAAGVRKEQIEKRQQLARMQEVERLNQLRGLVGAYRDLTQQMAMSNISLLLESYDSTRDANDQVLKDLATVQSIVKQRKDYYLFSDEPRIDDAADFKAATVIPDPVSQEMVGAGRSQAIGRGPILGRECVRRCPTGRRCGRAGARQGQYFGPLCARAGPRGPRCITNKG